MIILGIDPALSTTGWGVVKVNGNAASFVAGGVVKTNAKDSHADRLKTIYNDMQEIISIYQPDQVAVEEVYVNDNARTSLKLGQARGISLLVPSLHNIPVFEYTPTEIKKAIVGTGRAKKEQVQHMVKTLLPTAGFVTLDTSDALGVALCHFHIYSFKQKVS
ncbi:MAG: crossover junction endodeoxyribonuclease RuvC [Magnetococcales bacterium]|nr:crossover junction endodeoxyribonuclease RuvC [Magnetococcales bacterium]MEC8066711.1 crossover junction endodeoxyribonuclease RuvC [Pseudomonadota bacterium]|tara:strand:+ start:11932 stop:12417 length:486 start_codon:yes stop_codon:yes gene_type:complete